MILLLCFSTGKRSTPPPLEASELLPVEVATSVRERSEAPAQEVVTAREEAPEAVEEEGNALLRWVKPWLSDERRRSVSRRDAERFAELLGGLSREDQEASLEEILAELPDAHYNLIKPILMDPSREEELLELLLQDLLNRNEGLKEPLLRELRVLNDHPLKAEVERILEASATDDPPPDVSNETP